MQLNKLCQLGDFPEGFQHRKHWEIERALYALTDAGVVNLLDQAVLGVGGGVEPTGYRLTNHARQVFMTDRYLSDDWPTAPRDMLIAPAKHAPSGKWQPQRLVVQHMDGRELRYPDDFFAGIFSSSSIEHVGTDEDIRQVAREMGRVLQPGGLLTLATEFKLAGNGDGWEGVRLFDEEQLHDLIIVPSGCELVDTLDLTMDEDTLATAQSLDECIKAIQRGEAPVLPHIVLTHQGYTFTSVFLTLRKPGAMFAEVDFIEAPEIDTGPDLDAEILLQETKKKGRSRAR